MVIQHNLSALSANLSCKRISLSKSRTTEKLSSGYRINAAADDAAGLSISEKMRGQIRGMNRASLNAQDGISLLQTADGALNETHGILQQMYGLAVQAANDTNVSSDRQAIQCEIDALATEIDKISRQTEFNTLNLLDGSFKGKRLQVGANSGQMISMNLYAMDTHAFGFTMAFSSLTEDDWKQIENERIDVTNIESGDLTDIGYVGRKVYVATDPTRQDKGPTYDKFMDTLLVNNHTNAGHTMNLVKGGIEMVSQMRSHIGAAQNRLEHVVANLDNSAENLQISESKIRDADMAKEMVIFSKDDILMQASQAMLAQANQSTQGILALLR